MGTSGRGDSALSGRYIPEKGPTIADISTSTHTQLHAYIGYPAGERGHNCLRLKAAVFTPLLTLMYVCGVALL